MKKSALLFISFLYINISTFSQYTVLHDFNNIDGLGPTGYLISDGSYLYGTTLGGGTSLYDGVIFKVKPDGTGFAKLHDFGMGWDGKNPYGALFFDGTYLYGTTEEGGYVSTGIIYKIKPDGTGYTVIMEFDPHPSASGKRPYSSLISDGTFLYGTTSSGGTNDFGTIFKIKPDGSAFSVLFNFSSTSGGSSFAGLTYDGTHLYGTTGMAGNGNKGTVFKIKTDGTGFQKLIDFMGYTNGSYPSGSLISDGTYLYGMTGLGGINDLGTIFRVKLDGTGYSKLLDFNGIGNGASGFGSLIIEGGVIYGVTDGGGTAGRGVLFRILPDGTGYIKLKDGDIVQSFSGSLFSDGVYFYGTGVWCGLYSDGTVFKYKKPKHYNQSITICNGDSLMVASNSHTTTGVYSDLSYSSTSGCDSIVTSTLTVLPPNVYNQYPVLCGGGSVTVGSSTYSTSGSYIDVFSSMINGCDSIVITNLAALYSSSSTTQNITVCAGESFHLGTDVYSASGTYVYHYISGSCDSSVTTNLTILPPLAINITAIDSAGNYILSDTMNAGATYQWINCNTGNSIISGATGQNFLATNNGNYGVIVTLAGCSDTSSCYAVTNVGINETKLSNSISVYPNPSNGIFKVESETELEELEVINIFGITVVKRNAVDQKNLTIENLSAGTYILIVKDKKNNTFRKKIICQ